MTESSQIHNTLAPLRNVMSFMTMVERLDGRSSGIPGMGCFYGPAGFGKSMAAMYCAMRTEACLVQCESCWTPTALCEAILDELGIKPQSTVWRMAKQIQQALASEGIPLMIDEADHIVAKKYIELIRDIYEKSQVPVILIGEEAMPSKLRHWERINSRMLARVPAQPLDDEDFEVLRNIRCPDVELADDLVAAIKGASRGSARLIVNNLDSVRLEAQVRGVRRALSLADLGKFELHDGIPAEMRRLA
ncbi:MULTISPECIES: AAA family ATPase [unclassified Marinovum]|uniref:AAA family ATPase n=1 Tax=unclassified Marinovum TaxID=2647166 RepID=UPI003EDBCCA0